MFQNRWTAQVYATRVGVPMWLLFRMAETLDLYRSCLMQRSYEEGNP
jgi:hypothetical protein